MKHHNKIALLLVFQLAIVFISVLGFASNMVKGDAPWDPGDEQMRIVDPGDDIGKYSVGAGAGTIIIQSLLLVIVLLSIATFGLTYSVFKRGPVSAKTATKRK
ncbi:MAG: hypothetical protein ABIF08_03605 [Nanoarchaeota archaeon]